MQLHQLKASKNKKASKRVGRGGKRGTYSSRGMKGQKARAGRKLQPAIRQLIKRYPKLRGYRLGSKASDFVIVNIGELNKKFESGEKVSPRDLLQKKIISRAKGKLPAIKILGQGELEKKLTILDCKVSASAKEKIEKAGGTIIQPKPILKENNKDVASKNHSDI